MGRWPDTAGRLLESRCAPKPKPIVRYGRAGNGRGGCKSSKVSSIEFQFSCMDAHRTPHRRDVYCDFQLEVVQTKPKVRLATRSGIEGSRFVCVLDAELAQPIAIDDPHMVSRKILRHLIRHKGPVYYDCRVLCLAHRFEVDSSDWLHGPLALLLMASCVFGQFRLQKCELTARNAWEPRYVSCSSGTWERKNHPGSRFRDGHLRPGRVRRPGLWLALAVLC